MANIKVSEMTEATSFDDGDYTMIVQANQNKKISKENMIGNIEESIGNLSNLKAQIKTNIVFAINSVIDAEKYSTDEIKTNKTWIDGKPIYRTVVTFDSNTFVNNTILPTGITDFDDVVNLRCMIKASGSIEWRSIPWLYSAGSTFQSAWAGGVFLKENGSIMFQLGSSLANLDKAFVIIEYTKTTD